MGKGMSRKIKLGLLVPLAIGSVTLAASSGAAAAESAAAIRDFAYAPTTIRVSLGDTVTWTNDEEVMPHDVTSGVPGRPDVGELFASEILLPGQSFSFTFSAPGEYPYLCKLHPAMTGVVIVAADVDIPTE